MRRSMTLKDSYFLWLYDHIKSKKYSYIQLCKILNSKTFRWNIHNDDNRCQDGLNLRYLYLEENHLDEHHIEVAYWIKGDCTIFEMLVALAQRINDIMYDLDDQRDQTSKWFHEMILNLGLDIYQDGRNPDRRLNEMSELKIDDVLENLMDRTYDFNGHGSLFPMKNRPRKHRAEVEIWYQLMDWLEEVYGR